MGTRWLAVAGVTALALVTAACGSGSGNSGGGGSGGGSSASSPPVVNSASNVLKERKIGGTMVLTNAKGYTLYRFALDTSSTSKCNGSCATYWPPVKGPVTAGPGVTGKLGTIKRADGSTQASYDGHPLYTYSGDSAPGQAKGNGLNVSGGKWYEVTVSGAAVPAPAKSSSGGGYGGGY